MEETRMRELVDRLNETAAAYYAGEPVISDMQWDEMYAELQKLEKETGVILDDSPTHRVGTDRMDAFPEHRHLSPLWSMDKVQSIDELEKWIDRTEKLAGRTNLEYFVEYKFDGLTLNLTYDGGKLVQAATRGNGTVGEAILPQAKTIRSIPLTIPYKGLLEVQGECIMRLSVLEAYNKTAKTPLKNARNAAAGALRNLDPTVTAQRHLDAFFYQIGTIENPPFGSQTEMLDFIRAQGLPVSPYLGRPQGREGIEACIAEIQNARDSLDWLIDGVVIKVGDFALRQEMGYTDKFPRWAVAYKFEAEEAVTVLRDVTWELGRTGKLTPLAHLDPVDFYGVTVKRATLNNFGDIQRKQVAIGAKVWIRRSNDVIPEIMGRVGEKAEGEIEIVPPTHCPACGEKLIERGAHLFCMNRKSCRPQAVARVAHFASREAMDIDGFSEKTAEQLYDAIGLRDPADLYGLRTEDLLPLDGFKIRKAERLIQSVEKSKHCTLDALLFAIGIPNIGRKMARDLAHEFHTLEGVEQATQEELLKIPDVGGIVADSVVEFFSFQENLDMIRRLLDAGVTPESTKAPTGGAFMGMTVVVTGTLPTLSRTQAEDLIRACGGKASGSVSKKTSFVVAGENAGSKLTKAQDLAVEIIDEAEFLRRASQTNETQEAVSTEAGQETSMVKTVENGQMDAGQTTDAAETAEAVGPAIPSAVQPGKEAEQESMGLDTTVPVEHSILRDVITDRTWLEIDLSALEENYRQVQALTKSQITCVLKANAYGHGLVPIAKTLADLGCRSFAVSCLREAEALFKAGIPGCVLVLGTAESDRASAILAQYPDAELQLTVIDLADLPALNAIGRDVSVQLKIDTGFHRLGFAPDQETARQIADTLKVCPRIHVQGIYSHLGLIQTDLDEAQHDRFLKMVGWLADFGIEGETHLCDSIGLVRYPDWHMDRVRVGAFLYGVRPSRSEHMDFVCRETLRFCTRVSQVRNIAAGDVVGYGEERMTKDMRIATLCVGYGDGYPRHLSNGKGSVEINGVLCPTVGLICMDQMMVDVSRVPSCQRGDTVTLLGGSIPYGMFADWATTNRNEVLTMLSSRPLRLYMKDGREAGWLDEMLGACQLWS